MNPRANKSFKRGGGGGRPIPGDERGLRLNKDNDDDNNPANALFYFLN